MYRTNIDLTRHAIERYQKRHAPHLSYEEAEASLEQALPTATKLPEPSMGRRGGTQWQLKNPNVVLVTQLDPGADKHICVTILPIRTSEGFNEDELHVLEAAEETRARLKELQHVSTEAAERRKEAIERVKNPTISNRARHDVETQAQHAKKASTDAHAALESARLQATDIIEREKTIRDLHASREKTIRMADKENKGRLHRALRAALRELIRIEDAATLEKVRALMGETFDLKAFVTCHGHWPLDSEVEPEDRFPVDVPT